MKFAKILMELEDFMLSEANQKDKAKYLDNLTYLVLKNNNIKECKLSKEV